MRKSALIAACAGALALQSIRIDDREEAERLTSVEPDVVWPPEPSTNLPGETNRQYAARMKLEASQ